MTREIVKLPVESHTRDVHQWHIKHIQHAGSDTNVPDHECLARRYGALEQERIQLYEIAVVKKQDAIGRGELLGR